MLCTTLLNKVSHRGIFLLMLRNYSGNMSACLANIDGSTSITCNFIYHMGFQIFYQKMISGWASKFLSFLWKWFEYHTIFPVDLQKCEWCFSCIEQKHRFKLIFVDLMVLRCSFSVSFGATFSVVSFIQRLINKSIISILSRALFFCFETLWLVNDGWSLVYWSSRLAWVFLRIYSFCPPPPPQGWGKTE